MSDFPTGPAFRPFGVLGSLDPSSSVMGDTSVWGAGAFGSATWPTANLAFYIPILAEKTVTAYQIAVQVGTQSGNVDVGLYTEDGTRLVSSGSTAVGAAGIQAFNITDTVLSPGSYLIGMSVSNTTAAFVRKAKVDLLMRAGFMRQQASALPLPSTATFATVSAAAAYVPWVSVSTVATI